jgi:hypothetical protein
VAAASRRRTAVLVTVERISAPVPSRTVVPVR